MGWGEQHEVSLAEIVRTYIQRPTTGNFEQLKEALNRYDHAKKWA